jgi:hypothetical protein
MLRTSKIHLMGAAYCALIVSLDWYDVVQYSRGVGLLQNGCAPVIFAIAIAWLTFAVLGAGCIFEICRIITRGLRLSAAPWLPCRLVFFYSFPLLIVRHSTSLWVEADGATATRSTGFGAPDSRLFPLTVGSLGLLQVLVHLRTDRNGPNQSSNPTFSPSTSLSGYEPHQRGSF